MKKANNYILFLMFLGISVSSTNAQNLKQYEQKVFVKNNDTLRYRILYPENMKKGKKYPLVLFLHGSGERGTDNIKQLVHGGDYFVEKRNRKKYPAIVVFPQCPPNVKWTNRAKQQDKSGTWVFDFPVKKEAPVPTKLTNNLVDELLQSNIVDTKKVYIMGISMGGMGTLEFLYRWPNKYTAGVVICGGHDQKLAKKYSHVPVWFFHGEKDDIVPPIYSKQIYQVLKGSNSNTQYTLFSNDNHNSWDSTFKQPKLLKWLFKQKK